MKQINHSAKNIRIFLLLLTAFSALVLWRGFRGVDVPLKIKIGAGIAVLALFFSLLPRLFAPAYRAIMAASGFVGNTIFLVIAATVFFVLLTPLSLVMRLFGKAFMPSHRDQGAASYFESPHTAHGYDKQY
jgi:hypothetical protein